MSDSILFLGATGFVGGHVLHQLLASPSSSLKEFVIPVASSSKKNIVQRWIDEIQKGGEGKSKIEVEIPIIDRSSASHWYSEVKKLSARVDCCVQLATSDDLQLTNAINEGLSEGKKNNNKKGILVHASGAQVLESRVHGEHSETPNYDDTSIESIASIPDSAPHREIDLSIEKAFRSKQICGAIVSPVLVWGKGAGPERSTSIMVPDMVKKSLHNGRATYTGKGTNSWPAVHIEDCSDLIVEIIRKYLATPSADDDDDDAADKSTNYYFASYNDRVVEFRHIAEVIGKTLLEAGKVSTAETMSVPVPAVDPNAKGVRIEDAARSQADGEVDARTPMWPCRTTVRCQAKRGERDFGWKAKRDYTDEAIREDVVIVLETM
ncbi:hypothetical protein CBS101457_003176 [Exobasidium rhododendri]|nr:hypothetical protein CBS101457_003176 [Exobasidium rhododendri]